MPENTENEIYLSAQLVREWQDEYVALTSHRTDLTREQEALIKQINEANARLGVLLHKIKAAAPFSPKILEWLQEQEFVAQPDNVALTDAILKVFLRFATGIPIPRQNFVNVLPSVGYPAQKLNANPNYLYIALKRLRERELIEEVGGAGHFVITPKGRAEAQKK
jgi:hypothetical protein